MSQGNAGWKDNFFNLFERRVQVDSNAFLHCSVVNLQDDTQVSDDVLDAFTHWHYDIKFIFGIGILKKSSDFF